MFFIIVFSLFAAIGCKKDFSVNEISKKIEGVPFDDSEIYNDEANTFETNEIDTDTLDTPQYIGDSGPTVTKIVSITGPSVGTSQGLDDCGKFKYPKHYIVSSEPAVFTVILSRPDTVRSVIDASNSFGDAVEVVNFDQVGPTNLRITLRASKDTLQTKTVQLGIISGISLGTIGFPSMKFKLKCVGSLKDQNGISHLYGTNKWMELYHARLNNRTLSTPTPTVINADYVPAFGDVLLWTDGHTGTIVTQPTSVIRKKPKALGGEEYRQNRFWVSEMNSRCKGEKTVKYIWMKSYDLNTLKSANKDRGRATFYYRY